MLKVRLECNDAEIHRAKILELLNRVIFEISVPCMGMILTCKVNDLLTE